MRLLALGVLATALGHAQLGAPEAHAQGPLHNAIVIPSGKVTYAPAPDALPPGAKLAVLEGDPTKAGTFTMRLSMPDGYTIPPHVHPSPEHVTVVQGTFLVGMGAKLDASKFAALDAGSFGMLPPGMQHFARAKGATVIQLHGVGPWSLTYVNPADDPRNKPK